MILQIVLALVSGIVVGVLFKFIKLPVPAPPFIGIIGVVGIFLGAQIVSAFTSFL